MEILRVAVREENRVVAPDNRLRTHHVGKAAEVVEDSVLFRNARFDVLAVGSDGHVPKLAVAAEEIHVGEHGRRVLGAETYGVHHGWIQAVAADRRRVVGIADTDEPRLEPIREPLGVEPRNVRPLPRVDNHRRPLSGLYIHYTIHTTKRRIQQINPQP